jgi:fucose 4-O-acetylase-like acetyltransferase
MEAKKRILTIDFIKGLAILSVILLHTLPKKVLSISISSLHIGQAVPIFLFITLFLSFKGIQERGDSIKLYFNKTRVLRMLKQVVIPFLVVVIFQIGIYFIRNGGRIEIIDLIKRMEGSGPGSYYIWVYLQLWLMIPFFYYLFNRFKDFSYLILFVLCLALNYACVRLGISNSLYRLTCIRYLFLCVPVFIYLNKSNHKHYRLVVTIGMILSLIYLVLLKKHDLSPFVLNMGWSSQQWPTYFWTLVVFIFLVWCGNQMNSNNKLLLVLCWLGRNSWYIFLAQMFILSYLEADSLVFVDNHIINRMCFILLTMIISVVPALIIDYLMKNKTKRMLVNK